MTQIDTIEVQNQEIFGDAETHEIEMEFHDGYAISTDKQYGMSYPTLELINNNDNLCEKVYNYCGRGADEPFDSALTFGIIFKLPAADDWAEQRHDILMELLDEKQLAEYERKCAILDNAIKRDYFVIEVDFECDGGMKVTHIPDAKNSEDCATIAFDTLVIGSGVSAMSNAEMEDALGEIDLDEMLEVHHAFRENKQWPMSYFIVSKPHDDNVFIGMVWCRNGCSMDNKTAVLFFSSKSDVEKYVTDVKVAEFQRDLESIGITWNLELLEGEGGNAKCCGITAIQNGIPNFNVWGNDGYNVWIVNGRY